MNPLTTAKIVGYCFIGALLLIAGGFVFRWHGEAIAYKTLTKQVEAAEKQIKVCDTALLEDAPYIKVKDICSSAVGHVVAERDVHREEVANRDAQIKVLLKNRDQDTARAEARGIQLGKMKHAAQTAIDTAPHAPDGRIVCGFDCLRQLGGEASETN